MRCDICNEDDRLDKEGRCPDCRRKALAADGLLEVALGFDSEVILVLGEAESGVFDVPLAEYVRPQRGEDRDEYERESDFEDDVDEALAVAGLERIERHISSDDVDVAMVGSWVGVVVRRIEGDSAA